MAPRAITLEQVKQRAAAKGESRYEYLEVFMLEGASRLKMLCPEHGEFTVIASSHLTLGTGCRLCGNKAIGTAASSRKISLEEYAKKASVVHNNLYTYKSLDHTTSKATVLATCSIHGDFTLRLYAHMQGTKCQKCTYIDRAAARRYNLEDYASKASEVHGGKYEYKRLIQEKSKLSQVVYECPIHGERTQLAASHLQGVGCKVCGDEASGLAMRHDLQDFITRAKEVHGDIYTYKSLNYGANRRTTVTYSCSKHGEHTQEANGHLIGYGCLRCSQTSFKSVSKASVEVFAFLASIGLEAEQEYRFPGTRKLVDMVVPEQKLAIEYNGNYWHSSKYLASDYHKEKTDIAETNGYRMLHIWSHEWTNSREKVESIIRAATGKQTSKVFARKTQIYTPTPQEATDFMEATHIQGATSTGTYLALKYQGSLVAVMCFSDLTNHTELTRYSTNTSVVGGFTKLLSHYLRQNPQIQTVVSYSDNRMFTGAVYEKAGFSKVYTSSPNYLYLDGRNPVPKHKANYQKSKLIKRFGEEACRGKTERQITEENNIYRIYDCGLTKWLYTRV